NDAWKQMIAKVPAIRTQAFQLWLQPTIEALGWTLGPDPVDGAYVEPLDTYADMSHLIDKEDWPPEQTPGSIAYFCGPLSSVPESAPFTDHEFPARMTALVRENVLAFLHQDIGHLWPNGVEAGTQALDFDLLVDPLGLPGEARLDSQFIRANI